MYSFEPDMFIKQEPMSMNQDILSDYFNPYYYPLSYPLIMSPPVLPEYSTVQSNPSALSLKYPVMSPVSEYPSISVMSPTSDSTTSSQTPSLDHVWDFMTLPLPPSKPFQCQICHRAFARKYDLHRHIRIHTGDKPYSCPCCKKTFARTDALKRHLRMEETCRKSYQVQTLKNAGKRCFRNL